MALALTDACATSCVRSSGHALFSRYEVLQKALLVLSTSPVQLDGHDIVIGPLDVIQTDGGHEEFSPRHLVLVK